MKAGPLQEVIQFEILSTEQNEYGSDEATYTLSVPTKAQVQYRSGNKSNENDEITMVYEVDFIVRQYHKFNEFDRVVWNNKRYRILSIEHNKHLQMKRIRTELINE